VRTAVIVQARMGSKRFPGKVLQQLDRWPIIRHVLHRARQIGPHVILAIPHDDWGHFHTESWSIVCGPEDDVLERYLIAANAHGIDLIMRITADCPLLRPDLCRKVLDLYGGGGCSYAAIGWPEGGFPKGYGCEVFSRFTLQLANDLAKDQYDREHVTPWMERNVRCKYLQNDKDEAHLNYSVDTPEDLERLRALVRLEQSMKINV
jgi:spore coat polysaccharide biosynthesis protein SpsF (cytidylyltransferase family)